MCTSDGFVYDFNSQPREGGWPLFHMLVILLQYFNSQPREGGWLIELKGLGCNLAISTHSRAKAAGGRLKWVGVLPSYFNSQPREGGWYSLKRLPSLN